jgi:hypothetical protein
LDHRSERQKEQIDPVQDCDGYQRQVPVRQGGYRGDGLDTDRSHEYSTIPDQTHGFRDPERSKSRIDPLRWVTCGSSVTRDVGRTHERVAVSLLERAPRDASFVNGISTPAMRDRNDAAILYGQPRVTDATVDVCTSRTDNYKSTTYIKYRGVFRSPKRGIVRSTEPQRCIPSQFGAGFSRENGNSHLFAVSRTFEYGHHWRGPRLFERREDKNC